jgi:hypothetical protein
MDTARHARPLTDPTAERAGDRVSVEATSEPCTEPNERYVGELRFDHVRRLRADEHARVLARLTAGPRLLARHVASGVAITAGAAIALPSFAPAHALAFGGGAGVALATIAGLGLAHAAVTGGTGLRSAWTRVAAATLLGLAVTGTLLAPTELLPDTGVVTGAWSQAIAILRAMWVAIVLVGTGVLAIAIGQAVRLWQRRARLHADLAHGEVDVFLRADAAGATRSAASRLDVLRHAGIVLARDGEAASSWSFVEVAEVAPARPHAFRTPLPGGLVRVGGRAPAWMQRRSLSPGEHLEIGAHIRRLRRAAMPALAAVIAATAVLGIRVALEPDWHNLVDGVALGWYLLAGLAVVGLRRRLGAARRLASDLSLRWVVTIADPKAGPAGAPRLEVLPVSMLMWTEHQLPAGWRLHRT